MDEEAYLLDKVKREVLEEVDLSREITDEEMLQIIDEKLVSLTKESRLGLNEKNEMRYRLFYDIRKLDILQELVDDPEVTEIMVNGIAAIFLERKGRIYKWEKAFSSKEKLEDVIQQIVAKSNRMVNESTPIVDARLENGSRVNVVLYPVALNGPIITIRRFPDDPITMEKLIAWKSISREVSEFLEKLVVSGYNIFISGGTGSGKTTFLNVLSNFIPKDQRVITIEDSAELQIREVENLIRLETRNANIEGCNPITIRDLIKSALRMRPDRIIVGEVRGSEAIDMVQCLNTGHDGSLSTGHANNSKDMLSRLETMILMGMDIPIEAVQRQLASGIDIIVHLGRLRDKSRRVLEIVEILGYSEGEIKMNPLYLFQEECEAKDGKIIGSLHPVSRLKHLEKAIAAGVTL